MRNIILLGFILFLATGCNPIKLDSPSAKPTTPATTPQSQQTSTAPTYTNSIVTAPVDYIAATIKAGEQSKGVIDIAAISKAIENFEVTEGQKPQSLDELVQKHYLTTLPPAPVGKKIEYDPGTGKVSLVDDR